MSMPVYLHDFSHEADPHETALFYFFYLAVLIYINITCDIMFVSFMHLNDIGTKEKLTMGVMLFLLGPSIIPCIFCSIINITIIIKKKITDYPILLLVIFTMVVTFFLPNYLGLFCSLLTPMYLINLADNSVDKYDKILKLQLAEHDRKVEALLEKEQIIKKLHKSEDSSEDLIHIELTRAEDEYNILKSFD